MATRAGPNDTPAPDAPDAFGSLTRLRGQVAGFVLGLAALGFLAAWAFNRPPGAEGAYNQVALPLLSTVTGASFLLLRRRPEWLEDVSLASLSAISAHFLLKLGLTLFVFAQSTDLRLVLAPLSPWMPMLVIGAFVLLAPRRAVVFASVYCALAFAVVLAFLVSSEAARSSPAARNILVQQFVLANGAYLGLSYLLIELRRRHLEATLAAARLGQLAYTDALTGLRNRRWVDERLTDALGREGEDRTALFRRADEALYRAKAAGRDRSESDEPLPLH